MSTRAGDFLFGYTTFTCFNSITLDHSYAGEYDPNGVSLGMHELNTYYWVDWPFLTSKSLKFRDSRKTDSYLYIQDRVEIADLRSLVAVEFSWSMLPFNRMLQPRERKKYSKRVQCT